MFTTQPEMILGEWVNIKEKKSNNNSPEIRLLTTVGLLNFSNTYKLVIHVYLSVAKKNVGLTI